MNLHAAMQLPLIIALNLLTETCHLLAPSSVLYSRTMANAYQKKKITNTSLILIYIPKPILLSHIYFWGIHYVCFYLHGCFCKTVLSLALSHLTILLCKISLSAPKKYKLNHETSNIRTKSLNQQPSLQEVSLRNGVSDTQSSPSKALFSTEKTIICSCCSLKSSICLA